MGKGYIATTWKSTSGNLILKFKKVLITISIGGNLILKSKKVLIIIEIGAEEGGREGDKELDVLSRRGRVCEGGKRGLERDRGREKIIMPQIGKSQQMGEH